MTRPVLPSGVVPRRPRTAAGAGLALALVALTGCTSGPPAQLVGAQPSPAPAVHLLPIPTPPAAVRTSAQEASAHRRLPDGTVLPDAARTPGAVFPDVTRADVCDLHYTLGVRQPRFNDKVQAFAAYGISIHDRELYAVDHLVPTALGGSNALENLWPQPRRGRYAAAAKDRLEAQMRGLVCTGTVSLAQAQAAFRDWRAAADRYMHLPIAPGSAGLLARSEEAPPPPDAVTNGGACRTEGQVGRTRGKGVKFTCRRGADGQLRWQKRY